MFDSAIRVVLVDDHAIVLHGLESLFLAHHGFRVLACCRSGHDALDALRRGGVDVLVADLRMPDLSGIDVQRAVVAERLRCRTVMLTAAHTDLELIEMLRLGVMGLILKEASPATIIDGVRRVHRGERIVPQALVDRARREHLRQQNERRAQQEALTSREIEIVRLVALGRRNKAVAEALSIAEGTVKIHLHNIYQTLDVDGRLELVLWAQAHGMIP
jgi:DNA-binding NarL/FixJ family response regulator